jgi:hypothetical protein
MATMEDQGGYEDGSDSREGPVQAFIRQQVQPSKKTSQWCLWQLAAAAATMLS